MMARSRRWLIGIVATVGFLVMLYSCALPGDLAVGRDGNGLAGIYTVNGVDPTGLEYSGTIVIRDTDIPERFEVEWIVTGALQLGIGIRDGDRLTVEWTEVTDATGDGTGPIVYQLRSDGGMEGTWRAAGFDRAGVEQVFAEP
jgi:hypothetical protein